MYGMLVGIVYSAVALYKSPESGITIGSITSFLLYGQFLCYQFWKLSCVVGVLFGLTGAAEKIVWLLTHKPEMW